MTPRWNDSDDYSGQDAWDGTPGDPSRGYSHGSNAWGNTHNTGSAWDLDAETPGYNRDYPAPVYGEYQTSRYDGQESGPKSSPIPLRPLSSGETVTSALQLIRSNFVTLWLFPFLLSLVTVGFAVALGIIEGNATAWAIVILEGRDATISPYLVLNQIFSLVISVFIYVIVTNALLAAVYGQKVSILQATSMSRGDMGRLFVATLVYSAFLAVVLFAALYVLLSLVGATFLGSSSSLVFVFLAVLVVTIYLAIRFTCVVPALVAEDLGPIQAVVRSWQLTAGKAGHIFGSLIYLMVASFIISLIVMAPLNLVATPFLTGSDSLAANVIVPTVLAGIQSSAILPVSLAVSTVIYINMRFHKEGFHEQIEDQLR